MSNRYSTAPRARRSALSAKSGGFRPLSGMANCYLGTSNKQTLDPIRTCTLHLVDVPRVVGIGVRLCSERPRARVVQRPSRIRISLPHPALAPPGAFGAGWLSLRGALRWCPGSDLQLQAGDDDKSCGRAARGSDNARHHSRLTAGAQAPQASRAASVTPSRMPAASPSNRASHGWCGWRPIVPPLPV